MSTFLRDLVRAAFSLNRWLASRFRSISQHHVNDGVELLWYFAFHRAQSCRPFAWFVLAVRAFHNAADSANRIRVLARPVPVMRHWINPA